MKIKILYKILMFFIIHFHFKFFLKAKYEFLKYLKIFVNFNKIK